MKNITRKIVKAITHTELWPSYFIMFIKGFQVQKVNKAGETFYKYKGELYPAYLNDGNAGALWGHFAIFGANHRQTSISAIVGTGLGGGVIIEGSVVKGRKGFGGELGHVLIPYQGIPGVSGIQPLCNCGRTGDLESMCSLTAIENTLLPFFLTSQLRFAC